MRPLHQTGRCGSSSRGTLRVVLVAFGITVLASFADGFLPVGRLPVDPVPNYRQQKCRDPSRTSALSRGRQLPFAGPWPNVPRASRFHIHLASASSAANGESQGSDGATASGTAAAHWGQLSAETRRALEAKGIEAFTPVQEASFAPIRGGRDVVARSATGTGKTLAFLVPLIEAMLAGGTPAANEGAPLCMILAPTRELAQQVHREARAIAGEAAQYGSPRGRDGNGASAEGARSGACTSPWEPPAARSLRRQPHRTPPPRAPHPASAPPTPPHPAAPCAPSRCRAAHRAARRCRRTCSAGGSSRCGARRTSCSTRPTRSSTRAFPTRPARPPAFPTLGPNLSALLRSARSPNRTALTSLPATRQIDNIVAATPEVRSRRRGARGPARSAQRAARSAQRAAVS